MAFEATKKEWCELYTFFRLLADGKVVLGTAEAKIGEMSWPIAVIQREEHDGTRRYYIEEESVRIEGETGVKSMPREDFGIVADLILQAVKSSSENDVTSPEGVEEFLDEAGIFDLEAKTEDRTDFSVAFWHPEAPVRGFNVRSRLSAMNPLLDGGRAANLKLEQSGIKFATPTVNKINALPESPNEVSERMMLIERLGGVLKYSDVADRVFRSNLLIKDELINKHCFYEFKIKQFLMALALGMRPAKIYNGQDSAVEGILLVGGNGEVLCYHKSEKQVMEDFLFRNTRLEKGSLDKDKYGFLEKENGVYYFKLNAKIGLVKR